MEEAKAMCVFTQMEELCRQQTELSARKQKLLDELAQIDLSLNEIQKQFKPLRYSMEDIYNQIGLTHKHNKSLTIDTQQ